MKQILLLLLLLLLLCGCVRHDSHLNVRPSAVPGKILTKTAIPPQTSARSVTDPGNDPWEYCAAESDSDPVLLRVSELLPEEYRRRVQISFMIQNEDASSALIAQRCMGGKVYVCQTQEGRDCHSRLDFSAEPNETMLAICAYPEVEGAILTSAVVNWNTAYVWTCHDGKPVISGQEAEADAAGYDRSIWTEIPKPE